MVSVNEFGEPVVELRNVWFAYDREPVLKDITLSVPRGSFLGIVGPNGSGKTTLVKLLVGLARPQQGQVLLFGKDQGQFKDWAKIGYVPQKTPSLSTFPATVREIVATGRTPLRGLFRFHNRSDRRHVEEAIALVGLTKVADRPVSQLSGGQQQRVLMARALASQPLLLILDEPTVGVDTNTQQQFYSLLRRLRQDLGLTTIMISHDIGVVTSEVTHVACLNQRIYFHGPVTEFDPQSLSRVYGHPVTVLSHDH